MALLTHLIGAAPSYIEKVDTPPQITWVPLNTCGRMVTLKNEGDHRTIYRFQWPGVYFTATFTGTEVYFAVGPGAAILHLIIDDQPALPLVKPDSGVYRVGDLAAGSHTIRIEFVNESQSSLMEFGGIAQTGGQVAAVPPRPVRQLEIIGDSHTVGYGNTSKKRQCASEEIWTTTDNSLAFGPLTAKHYRADYQINAISGRGIVRNYGGGPGDPLPVVYPYVRFDKQAVVADKTWQPQIIVVALGTNDFSTQLHDGGKWKTRAELRADFERTYVHFVQQLRAENSRAFFILAANDAMDGEIQDEVRKVVGQLEVAGEKRVAFVAFNHLQLTACDWHPSLADHEMMADALRQFIDSRPELWSAR